MREAVIRLEDECRRLILQEFFKDHASVLIILDGFIKFVQLVVSCAESRHGPAVVSDNLFRLCGRKVLCGVSVRLEPSQLFFEPFKSITRAAVVFTAKCLQTASYQLATFE